MVGESDRGTKREHRQAGDAQDPDADDGYVGNYLALAWLLLGSSLAGVVLWLHFAAAPSDPQPTAETKPAAIVEPPAAPPVADKSPAPSPAAAKEAPEPQKIVEVPAPSVRLVPRDERVAPAFDAALVGPSPDGPVPIVAADGRQAWRVYARPFDAADKRPRIAIVIGDLGLSQTATLGAIQNLPSDVTLAFTPYAGGLKNWLTQARGAGHEVLLQLPMEPNDFPASDPGPRALMTALSTDDNLKRVNWILARAGGYVGLTNSMGSRFSASADDLRPVLARLKSHGLLYVDSRASAASVAAKLAGELGLPFASNSRFIDVEVSRSAIDARLEELERIAKANGAALGIGLPYPATIERVAAWAQGLEKRGIALAPVSAVVNRQPSE